MTDVLSGTDMASVPMPDGATGFGGIEIAYLIARHQGPSSERTSTLLLVPPDFYSEEMQTVAVSTLLARGYLEVTETSLQSRSGAALLEFAAARATKWIQFGQLQPGVGFALLLRSPEVTAQLSYFAYDAWHCTFANTAAEFTDSMMDMFDARMPVGGPNSAYLNLSGLLESDRAMNVSRAGADEWHIGTSNDETGETTNTTLTRSEFTALLSHLLAE